MNHSEAATSLDLSMSFALQFNGSMLGSAPRALGPSFISQLPWIPVMLLTGI